MVVFNRENCFQVFILLLFEVSILLFIKKVMLIKFMIKLKILCRFIFLFGKNICVSGKIIRVIVVILMFVKFDVIYC